MFKKTTMAMAIAMSTSVFLVACGSNGDNNGAVVGASSAASTSPLIGTDATPTLTASAFSAALGASTSGQGILSLAGTPKCDVTITHIRYNTIDAQGKPTTASGALMVPTGSDASCTGARPVVLYAHGTTVSQGYNLASLTTDPSNAANGEGTLVAATFAAQGYIVIAPNYAGYDTSTLPYHPYVDYQQQSQEMISALQAGRAALPAATTGSTTSDSGKLFVTGYSEGGYVAMATLKAMDAEGIHVTAGAPMSGPYNLAAYGDAIFYGNTALGGTEFAPLLTTGYQAAYGNIYPTTGQPADVYTAAFAPGIAAGILTPSNAAFAASLTDATNLPGLFQSVTGTNGDQVDPITGADVTTSQFSFGFSPTNYEVQTSYRGAYLADAQANPDGAVPTLTASPLPATAPANSLRQAFKLNDLRGYFPSMPVLMCGGNQDPTVFFSVNAKLTAGILSSAAASGVPVAYALLDVDPTDPATSTSTASSTVAVGFSASPLLGTTVTNTMSAVSSQLETAFAQNLNATATAAGNAAGQAYGANPPAAVVTQATAAGQAAYAQALNNGESTTAAAAAAQAASTAVVTAAAQAYGTAVAKETVAGEYHGTLVPPFCTTAARTFFQQY